MDRHNKFGANIHSSQMTYPNDSGDYLTSPLTPPTAWNLFWNISTIGQMAMKFSFYSLNDASAGQACIQADTLVTLSG